MVYDPDAIYQDADIEMIHATEASNERHVAEAEAQAEAEALDKRTKEETECGCIKGVQVCDYHFSFNSNHKIAYAYIQQEG